MAIARPKHIHLKSLRSGDPQAELAVKSTNLLGYRGVRWSGRRVGKLGLTLAKLEIEPLNEKQVEIYKRKKIEAENNKLERKGLDLNEWSVERRNYTLVVEWKAIPLRGYEKPVPDFVLNKAVQIAEKLPQAVFHVEEFQVREVPLPDPFLVVSYEGERYWIEVWDEKDFERTM